VHDLLVRPASIMYVPSSQDIVCEKLEHAPQQLCDVDIFNTGCGFLTRVLIHSTDRFECSGNR